MIATGTDIKPLEIVFFMRSVRSKNFFEQMKGRGVRVVSETEMEQVNPGVKRKTRFVIVDAVGVCESDKTESRPLEKKPTVSFDKLLDAVALGNRNRSAGNARRSPHPFGTRFDEALEAEVRRPPKARRSARSRKACLRPLIPTKWKRRPASWHWNNSGGTPLPL